MLNNFRIIVFVLIPFFSYSQDKLRIVRIDTLYFDTLKMKLFENVLPIADSYKVLKSAQLRCKVGLKEYDVKINSINQEEWFYKIYCKRKKKIVIYLDDIIKKDAITKNDTKCIPMKITIRKKKNYRWYIGGHFSMWVPFASYRKYKIEIDYNK